MRKWLKRMLITLGAVVAAYVVGLILLMGLPGTTKEPVSLADAFHPPSGWTLKSEQIHPYFYICTGDVACPTVIRQWTASTPLRASELDALMQNAHYIIPTFEQSGEVCSGDDASTSGCLTRGEVDFEGRRYHILIDQEAVDVNNPDLGYCLVLSISGR